MTSKNGEKASPRPPQTYWSEEKNGSEKRGEGGNGNGNGKSARMIEMHNIYNIPVAKCKQGIE